MEKAIIVPVNPDRAYAGGSFIGTVLPHITHIRRTGGVLWNCGRSLPRDHQEIKKGYFYETNRHAITYEFEIMRFFDWSNIEELSRFVEECAKPEPELKEAKYVPEFRWFDLAAIEEEFLTEERHAAIGILIKAIYPLENPMDPWDFIKVSDNKPVKARSGVRAHPVVYTSTRAKPRKHEIDTKDVLHSHMRKIIDQGRFDEKDIEDMLEYILYDSNCELVDRQPSLKSGRIDMVYKKAGTYFVIELKRKSASIAALQQIKKYMDEIKGKHNPKKLKGLIICETASKGLKEAAAKIDDISLREYRFSIDLGLEL